MSKELTQRARRVLGIAGSIAAERGAGAVEPEHLFAGVIIEGKGLPARLFAAARVSTENIARAIALDMTKYQRAWELPSIDHPYGGDVNRILEFAADEATRLGHQHVGPEHLLLGVLRATDLELGAVLRDKGLRLEEMRRHLSTLLDEKTEVRQRSSSYADERPPDSLTVEALRAAGGCLPRVLREVNPRYSRSAFQRGVHGEVILEGVVSPDGWVNGIRVLRAVDPELDELAIQALQQWQLTPATIDGHPVPVIVRFELPFRLR